jgi:hypothetical protein
MNGSIFLLTAVGPPLDEIRPHECEVFAQVFLSMILGTNFSNQIWSNGPF